MTKKIDKRQFKRSFTKEFKQQIVELKKSGTPTSEIVKEHNLDATTINRWVREAEGRPYGKDVTETDKKVVEAAYATRRERDYWETQTVKAQKEVEYLSKKYSKVVQESKALREENQQIKKESIDMKKALETSTKELTALAKDHAVLLQEYEALRQAVFTLGNAVSILGRKV